MKLHTIRLEGGPAGPDTLLTIDGKPIEGVEAVHIKVRKDRFNLVVIALTASVDIGINGIVDIQEQATE